MTASSRVRGTVQAWNMAKYSPLGPLFGDTIELGLKGLLPKKEHGNRDGDSMPHNEKGEKYGLLERIQG